MTAGTAPAAERPDGAAPWGERRRVALLVAITFGALLLRLWGLRWGAPWRVDLHPDEIDYVIRHAERISLENLDPGFLNYPAFLMYLIHFSAAALRRIDLIQEGWQVHLVGRAWSALFGAATAPAAYLLARELGAQSRAGLLAALWTALLPLAVWESHVAVTDVPMTFWTVVALWLAVRLLRTDGWRDWAVAGAALGLATGSKYTAALATAAILLAAVLARRPPARLARGLAIAGASALAACFLVTPYSFLRLPDTLAALAYERRHTTGHHYGFSLPADGPQYRRWVYQLTAAWPFSFGLGLYASVLAGAAWTVRRLNRRTAVVLGFSALFFGVTGSWTLTPLRYYLPLLVVGAVLAGLWQGAWLGDVARWRRLVASGAVLLALGYTSVFTWQTTRRYADDTRIRAARWMDAYRPEGSVLIVGWGRYLAQPPPGSAMRAFGGIESDLLDPAKRSSYDLVQVSSLVFSRHRRHGDVAGMAAYAALGAPGSGMRLVKRFEAPFLNRELYEQLDPMFGGYFVSPTLEFYEPVERR